MSKKLLTITHHHSILVKGLKSNQVILLTNELHVLKKDIKYELNRGTLRIDYEDDSLHDQINQLIQKYSEQ